DSGSQRDDEPELGRASQRDDAPRERRQKGRCNDREDGHESPFMRLGLNVRKMRPGVKWPYPVRVAATRIPDRLALQGRRLTRQRVEDLAETAVAPLLASVGRRHDFQVDHAALDFYGLCRACRRKR